MSLFTLPINYPYTDKDKETFDMAIATEISHQEIVKRLSTHSINRK